MKHSWPAFLSASVIDFPDCLDFCYQNKVQVLACLPAVIAELAGLHNFESALQLTQTCGGRKLYLPRSDTLFSEITGTRLPADIYHRWRLRVGNTGQIEIPSRWGIFLALRRAAILTAIKEGASDRELLTLFGITLRQLRNIRDRQSGG